jgi:hypothetical protein
MLARSLAGSLAGSLKLHLDWCKWEWWLEKNMFRAFVMLEETAKCGRCPGLVPVLDARA